MPQTLRAVLGGLRAVTLRQRPGPIYARLVTRRDPTVTIR
jgi:hypothetical protein